MIIVHVYVASWRLSERRSEAKNELKSEAVFLHFAFHFDVRKWNFLQRFTIVIVMWLEGVLIYNKLSLWLQNYFQLDFPLFFSFQLYWHHVVVVNPWLWSMIVKKCCQVIQVTLFWPITKKQKLFTSFGLFILLSNTIDFICKIHTRELIWWWEEISLLLLGKRMKI